MLVMDSGARLLYLNCHCLEALTSARRTVRFAGDKTGNLGSECYEPAENNINQGLGARCDAFYGDTSVEVALSLSAVLDGWMLNERSHV